MSILTLRSSKSDYEHDIALYHSFSLRKLAERSGSPNIKTKRPNNEEEVKEINISFLAENSFQQSVSSGLKLTHLNSSDDRDHENSVEIGKRLGIDEQSTQFATTDERSEPIKYDLDTWKIQASFKKEKKRMVRSRINAGANLKKLLKEVKSKSYDYEHSNDITSSYKEYQKDTCDKQALMKERLRFVQDRIADYSIKRKNKLVRNQMEILTLLEEKYKKKAHLLGRKQIRRAAKSADLKTERKVRFANDQNVAIHKMSNNEEIKIELEAEPSPKPAQERPELSILEDSFKDLVSKVQSHLSILPKGSLRSENHNYIVKHIEMSEIESNFYNHLEKLSEKEAEMEAAKKLEIETRINNFMLQMMQLEKELNKKFLGLKFRQLRENLQNREGLWVASDENIHNIRDCLELLRDKSGDKTLEYRIFISMLNFGIFENMESSEIIKIISEGAIRVKTKGTSEILNDVRSFELILRGRVKVSENNMTIARAIGNILKKRKNQKIYNKFEFEIRDADYISRNILNLKSKISGNSRSNIRLQYEEDTTVLQIRLTDEIVDIFEKHELDDLYKKMLFLREQSFFEHLGFSGIRNLAGDTYRAIRNYGEYLFKSKEESKGLHIIIQGKVQVASILYLVGIFWTWKRRNQ